MSLAGLKGPVLQEEERKRVKGKNEDAQKMTKPFKVLAHNSIELESSGDEQSGVPRD